MVDVKINAEAKDKASLYNFQLLSGRPSCLTHNKEFKEYLMKWSMKGRIFCQCYCFDCYFRPHSAKEFLLDFFSDSAVVNSLQTASDSGNPTVLGEKPSSIEIAKVTCSLTTLDIFNRLNGEVVREDGHIVRCFDEWIGEIQIADQLRQMLLNEDSESYLLYNESERDEFLFRLLAHVSIGGRLCQYEDTIQAYLDMAKTLYKEIVAVQKDPDTKQLQVLSHVYSVTLKDSQGRDFYPDTNGDSPNSFAYAVIDPLKRHVTVLHHKFGNGLF